MFSYWNIKVYPRTYRYVLLGWQVRTAILGLGRLAIRMVNGALRVGDLTAA